MRDSFKLTCCAAIVLASTGLASAGLASAGLASAGLASTGLAFADAPWPMTTSEIGYGDPGAGVTQPAAIFEGRSAFSPTEPGAFNQYPGQSDFLSEGAEMPQGQ
jgi:hypothetical protein